MLCVFMLLSAASYFFRPKEPEISYAEVVQLFEQEKVKSFAVQDTTLTLKLREAVDGKTELRKELYDFDLFYDDLNDLVVEQKAAGILEDYNYSANHSPNYLAIALPYVIAVAGLFAIWYFFSMRASGGGNDRMAKFGNATFRHGSESARKTTFADVAGADEEKEELAEIVDFLRDPQRFVELGARIPKGVLLVGPPGTGKTLLARAVAGEAGVEFLSISGSDFVEMYVGVGASRVRDLFEQAKKAAPCIIFIDEIDAVGRQRGTGLGGGHDEREQTLNQLLVEMDGFGTNDGVVVLAATNRADILDPALLRPSRFDRQIYVGYPDIKGREDVLKIHTANKPLAEDVDLAKVARGTAGFTGADLENLSNEAALLCARRGDQFITMADFEEAEIKVLAGPEKRSRVVPEHERKLTAYHEAGHAVVMHALPTHEPVHRITIVPRGQAGGMTIALPDEDHSYQSKRYMEEQIVSLLGGRAAEKLMLGDISTGASNDIERASHIARKMVTAYGMSEKLGSIAFESGHDEVFIGKTMGQTRSYSEKTAAEIDDEVKAIIDRAYARCEEILTARREALTAVAEYLLAHETMTGEEFERMVGEKA
ncbi:ATP-dependent zinc metalloprotease FtsH [Oscillibacter sp. MSJ-31]|uniref:ATP-dependent zinc metalloprotease FtsH n=1 Tax=Oscillibacter sp. MSJ-31 TaxID=2841526 RepID=UPI001C121ADD|nr:ATP-dependent zinc metalloprotease FtsH [Oscillibacter sp. MSJ-31]MBU5457699.1 ATP-dependent zinc metalloprotease FtsH [Oscillibacter sp. MSJ-31]